MNENKFYFIMNEETKEVWSGYKWKKGTWQKAMLYKRGDTAYNKLNELSSMGYSCVVVLMTVILEDM